MRSKTLFMSAFVAACASITQFWFCTSVAMQSKVCYKIFADQNTSVGNWQECTLSLEQQQMLPYHCTCKEEEQDVTRRFDTAAVIIAVLGGSFVGALEVLRNAAALISVIQREKHGLLCVDAFSIGGIILLLTNSELRKHRDWKNDGSFVPLIDILILALVFRYAAVTNEGIFQREHPLQHVVFLCTLLNIIRGCMLNIQYYYLPQWCRNEERDENAILIIVP